MTPDNASLSSKFEIDGQTVRLLQAIQVSNAEFIEEFKRAIVKIAQNGAEKIELDFRKSEALSSSIIALTFIAVSAVKDYPASIVIIASMTHNRPLVAAGMTSYVDVRLCG